MTKQTKISGRHKSVPREIKRALSKVLDRDAKVVMQDICSCRHAYAPGTLRITEEATTSLKIRAYFGSGIVNLFVKFPSEIEKDLAKEKLSD